jgi:hypothetical protein
METSKTTDDKKVQQQDVEHARADDETSSLGKGDILQLEHTDPILNAKMHLVNNAIDEVCPSLTSSLPKHVRSSSIFSNFRRI